MHNIDNLTLKNDVEQQTLRNGRPKQPPGFELVDILIYVKLDVHQTLKRSKGKKGLSKESKGSKEEGFSKTHSNIDIETIITLDSRTKLVEESL